MAFHQAGPSRLVSHQGGLSAGWYFIKVVFHQVVCHQGGFSSSGSFFRVVFHHVICHQGGLSTGWFIIRVIFHMGWFLIKAVFHQWFSSYNVSTFKESCFNHTEVKIRCCTLITACCLGNYVFVIQHWNS